MVQVEQPFLLMSVAFSSLLFASFNGIHGMRKTTSGTKRPVLWCLGSLICWSTGENDKHTESAMCLTSSLLDSVNHFNAWIGLKTTGRVFVFFCYSRTVWKGDHDSGSKKLNS